MFDKDLSAGARSTRRRGWEKVRRRRSIAVVAEVLEERRLLSRIVWDDEGSTTGRNRSDSDGFGAIYGANAPLARAIVEQAMNDWSRVIANFNYTHVGKAGYAPFANTFHLSIRAANLGGANLGLTRIFGADRAGTDYVGDSHVVRLPKGTIFGKPYDAGVTLDDNGGGRGWFFDPDPTDSAEFPNVVGPSHALGDIGGRYDFYSSALRLIGKAVGLDSESTKLEFKIRQAIATSERPFDPRTGKLNVMYPTFYNDPRTGAPVTTFTTNEGATGLYPGPLTPELAQHADSRVLPDDLMTADPQPNARDRISDVDAALLRYYYNLSTPMAVINPTDLGMSVLSSLDLLTGVLRVSGDPTVPANQIDIAQDSSSVYVTINGRQKLYPTDSVRSIAVTLTGDDRVFLATTRSATVVGPGRGTLAVGVPATGTVSVLDQAILMSNSAGSVLSAISYHGLARLETDAAIGQGTVLVGSTAASTPLSIRNVARVALGANLDSILGPVDISGIVSQLTIDDSASTVARGAALFRTAVTGLAPAPITFGGATLATFRLLTPKAASSLIVADTPDNVLTQVTMGPAGDAALVQRTTGSLLLDMTGGANVVLADFARLLGTVSVFGTPGGVSLFAQSGIPGVLATMGTYPGLGIGYALSSGRAPLIYSISALTSLTVQLAAPPAGSLGALLSVDDTAQGRPGFATFIQLGGAADYVDVVKSSGLLAIVGKGGAGTQVRIGGQVAKSLAGLNGQVTIVNAGLEALDQNAPAAEVIGFGADRLTVNGKTAVNLAGATRLQYTGPNRANTYNIDGTPGGDLTVNGGTAADTFKIAPTSRALLGLGQVVVSGGGGGDTLTIDDSKSIGSAVYSVTSGQVFSLPVVAVQRGKSVVYGLDLASASLIGTDAPSLYGISAAQNGIPTTIRGGAGDDGFLMQATEAGAPLTLDGGGGTNTLDYSQVKLPPAADPPAESGGGDGGASVPSGLVAWYRAEGNAADVTGNHDGSASAGAYGPGQVGQAFQLDGSGGVLVPDQFDLNFSTFTVEAWVKPGVNDGPVPTARHYIVAKGAGGTFGYGLAITGDVLSFQVRLGSFPFSLSAEATVDPATWLNQWHHVAGSYDGRTARLYLDGVPVASVTSDASYAGSSGGDLAIGRTTDGPLVGYTGSIDEVSLYGRTLSDEEVHTDYTDGRRGAPASTTTGLVARYRGELNADDATGRHNGRSIAVTYGTGEVERAFQFDGQSVVTVPDSPDLNSPNFTLETWVNPTPEPTSSTYRFIASKGADNAIGLYTYSNSQLTFQIQTYSAAGSPSVSVPLDPGTWTGRWHHLAATFDGAMLRLYIDGALVGSQTSRAPVSFTGSQDRALRIGNTLSSTRSGFLGSIDETTLYNRALSDAEIQSIFAAGPLGKAGAPAVPPPQAPGVEVDLKSGKATGFAGRIARIQKIVGTAKSDILVGDGGADLDGGGGRDLLIAGRAAGRITSRGDSILIGGTTAYDADFAALDAVLAAWTRTGTTYQDRVSALVNGLLTPGKVTGNGQRNTLNGGAGMSLFFHSTQDATDRRDDESEVIL